MINLTSEDNYKNIIQQINDTSDHKIFGFFKEEDYIENELPYFIESALKGNKHKQIGIVLDEFTFLPHLSITDNLFICSTIKPNAQKAVLRDWIATFDFSMSIMSESFEELSKLEQIKLQLLQLILSDKEKIILANDFSKLTIFEKQLLLPLLKELTKKAGISVWLITDDEKIVNSPYIDTTIKEPL